PLASNWHFYHSEDAPGRLAPTNTSLISVLVTEIQPPCVGTAKECWTPGVFSRRRRGAAGFL
ncbi:hypothetical protein, partial [Ensifer sp. 22460]|uniref:hypothetical protein n=1 Tax=Ensifer sp. 22460 TaxID=3453922 RepID=UPI003F8481E4